MTATPTISADATGISDTARSKTGGVVDLLTSPDVAAGVDTIVHVPIKYVVPHPRNRKILDDDVADLVAEFKAGVPILNALGVTAAADWNANRPAELKEIGPREFIITAGGHRRLRAAELAGLATVPCVIRPTFAGVDGRRAALLENLHRQDLDPFEEAAAFEELTGEPYKLSQRDLAGIVGCNQSHISKRLKLLKLPSTVRESVRVGKMHLGDAVELARVADDKKLLNAAIEKVKQWRWDGKRAVDQVLEEHDREQKANAEIERLTAAGTRVIDRAPGYQATASTRDPVRLDALGIKTVSHKKEPCHAAHVRISYNGVDTTYCCTEPKRHIGAKGDSTIKATKVTSSSSGRAVSDSERAAKKRRTEIKKNVNPARRAIVQQLVSTGGLDAQTRRDVITYSVIFRLTGGYSHPDEDVAIDLFGIRPANTGAYLHSVLTEHIKTAKPETAALVGALAYFEGRLNDPGQYSPWTEPDRWYLDTLARNGYVITDAEHEQLRDVRSDDGTWSAPAPDEPGHDPADGPACRVCFCFLDELPAGVTQVAEDLCSACSDAKDAGWVDGDAAATAIAEGRCAECEHAEPDVDCSCPHCFCNTANVDEPAVTVAG